MTTKPTRQRLPTTRTGRTHKIAIGTNNLYITVNCDSDGRPLELFGKASNGHQGMTDALCVTASLALQYGAPLEKLVSKWRGMRFAPDGIEASSIPDAIARMIEKEYAT